MSGLILVSLLATAALAAYADTDANPKLRMPASPVLR